MKIRSPEEIIDQVLAVPSLPPEMRLAFRNLHLSLSCDVAQSWWEICKLFTAFVPKPPTEDWHFEAAAALMNTTIDAIRRQFPGGN